MTATGPFNTRCSGQSEGRAHARQEPGRSLPLDKQWLKENCIYKRQKKRQGERKIGEVRMCQLTVGGRRDMIIGNASSALCEKNIHSVRLCVCLQRSQK